MKTLHFASVLALVAMTAFACSDQEDDSSPGKDGKGGSSADAGAAGESAGSAGKDGSSTAGSGGKGGSSNGSYAGESGSGTGGTAPSAAGAGGDDNVGVAGSGGDSGAGGMAGGGGATDTDGTAGAGGDNNLPPPPLEIIGEWLDNWDTEQLIDATTWNDTTIVLYDNATNTVYVQNPADADYNPSMFSKLVYTEPANDSFYFCTIAYGKSTLAEAQADPAVADATDPDTAGCGPFPWSKATKP